MSISLYFFLGNSIFWKLMSWIYGYLVQSTNNRRQHWCWEHKLYVSHLWRKFRPVPGTSNRKRGRLEARLCYNNTGCCCVHLKQKRWLIIDDTWIVCWKYDCFCFYCCCCYCCEHIPDNIVSVIKMYHPKPAHVFLKKHWRDLSRNQFLILKTW